MLDLVERMIVALRVAVGAGQDGSLVTELLEGLLCGNVTKIEQNLVPEARIQQVKDGVLCAADIEVDGCPLTLDFVRPRLLVIVRIEVTQIVPT